MRFPLTQVAGMATYIAKNKMRPRPEWQKNLARAGRREQSLPHRAYADSFGQERGGKPHPMINKRFPLVMMLEPLHACNLTCTGCGRIREYETSIRERLSLEQCLKAVDECGAPMISICGGEPLLYPEIPQLCAEILARGKYIQLCTNGMFLAKKLKDFKPHPGLVFNVHLDGMEKNHDLAVEREGVFKAAIEGIKLAKEAGFKVFTNTTVYRETDMNEIWEMYEFLEQFKVDGHTISPAYGYSSVNDQEIFMTREDVHEKFKDIDKFAKRFPLVSSPGVHGFSEGRARTSLHGVGQSDLQRERLEGPVLPDHGRAPRHVRGSDDQDAVGKLRRGQRSALRAVHGALRVRAVVRLRDQLQIQRSVQNAELAAGLIRSNR